MDARRPAAGEDGDDAFFVRIPGASLRTGARPTYRMTAAVARPQRDRDYQLALGQTRFGFTVGQAAGTLTYTIRYAGQEHVYAVGRADAVTAVKAIADLDGDAQPDFIVDVGDQTFLLLSGQAAPGPNLPTAELWASRGC